MKKRMKNLVMATGGLLCSAAILFPAVQAAAAPADIGLEGAKQAACAHNGLATDQVTFTKAELDYNDGIKVYEIKYVAGNYKYEYDVDCSTGALVKGEFELITGTASTSAPAPAPVTPAPSTGNTSNTSGSVMDQNKALDIALKRAGVSKDNIRKLDIDLDYEYGVQVYEIEFKSGYMEYDFEINAVDGSILSYEVDND